LDLFDLLLNCELLDRGVSGCCDNNFTFSSVTDGGLHGGLGDIDCCIPEGIGLA
jgi:hypothetical protein